MQTKTTAFLLGTLSLASVLSGSARAADSIRLRSDRVVPVIVDQDLSIKDSRRGDRFTATVEDDRDLPRGTRFEGRVVDIEQKRDNKPGFMDLEFTSVRLPDGTRVRIDSKPISMDAAKKGRDGHFTAKPAIRKETSVLGGAGVGLVLGALLKKPFEGAFIGALAGIIVAETGAADKYSNGDVVAKKGSRLGALILRDFSTTYDDRRISDGRDSDRDLDRERDLDRDRDDSQDRDGDRDRHEIRLTYRNHALDFDGEESPFYEGSTLMVPLNKTASQLGLAVDRTKNKTIYIEDDNASLKIEQDSTAYRLNGKKGNLSSPVREKDGVIYVPIEILAAMKEEAIFLNGSRIEIRA